MYKGTESSVCVTYPVKYNIIPSVGCTGKVERVFQIPGNTGDGGGWGQEAANGASLPLRGQTNGLLVACSKRSLFRWLGCEIIFWPLVTTGTQMQRWCFFIFKVYTCTPKIYFFLYVKGTLHQCSKIRFIK